MITHEVILRMSVSEFKAFKRAIQIMCRMGLMYSVAVDILLSAYQQERENRNKWKSA